MKEQINENEIKKYTEFLKDLKSRCDNNTKFSITKMVIEYGINSRASKALINLKYISRKGKRNKPNYTFLLSSIQPINARNLIQESRNLDLDAHRKRTLKHKITTNSNKISEYVPNGIYKLSDSNGLSKEVSIINGQITKIIISI